MPNPTPVYPIKYDGTTLPGYGRAEDVPLSHRKSQTGVLGRDGGTIADRGADFRTINVAMRVLSSASNGSTGLQHLQNCYAQWRSALATCSRVSGSAALYLGDTDRYINAEFLGSTAPIDASNSRAITYNLSFVGNPPWFIGATVSANKMISGNNTVAVNIGDTRKTYPTITIPSGITRITMSHAVTGKSFTLSGSHASDWIVDCAALTVTSGSTVNGIHYLTSSPDFGIYHVGSGTLTLSTSNVAGAGTVSVQLTPRYER